MPLFGLFFKNKLPLKGIFTQQKKFNDIIIIVTKENENKIPAMIPFFTVLLNPRPELHNVLINI